MFELDMLSYLMGKKAGGGSGGGAGGSAEIDALITGTITELNSGAASVGTYAFYRCTALKSVNLPAATSIGEYGFGSCSGLENINFPAVTNIGKYAFSGCSKLTSVKFPLATTVNSYAFQSCSKLERVDFPVATSMGLLFGTSSSVKSLIVRSNTVCSLTVMNAFSSSPIASGTGYIYVPSALVSSYKSATNWKTYAAQFRALENYTVDGTVTGELDESKI